MLDCNLNFDYILVENFKATDLLPVKNGMTNCQIVSRKMSNKCF